MPARELRHLLLLSLDDAWSPQAWSGIPFQMREALERKIDRVTVVTNVRPKRTLLHGALRAGLGGTPPRYPLYLTPPAQKEFARIAEETIDREQPDAVLSISTHFLVGMKEFRVPTFTFSDAPWISYREVYRDFERPPLQTRRFAEQEAMVARKCAGMIFPSHWAAREAERVYGIPSGRVHVQPMGANFAPPLSGQAIEAAIEARPFDRLNLLYVGKDWLRKGGSLAVEIAMELRRSGAPGVCLHIVGCRPELPPTAEDVLTVHGLLRMSDPTERAELEALFLQSHFLVVPTVADCFGLVFAEAQAFGLPPVSRAVQATPEIILDGCTGLLCAPDAPATAYARRILEIFGDPSRYRRMATSGLQRYQQDLRWDSFAQGVVDTIHRHL